MAAGVDILVCDFGQPQESKALSEILDAIMQSTRIVIAAAGNSGNPTWPAWQKNVLAVGALTVDGAPKDYSPSFQK